MRPRPLYRHLGRARFVAVIAALLFAGSALALVAAPRQARAISLCLATIHCTSLNVVPFDLGSGTVTTGDAVLDCVVTSGVPTGTCDPVFEWPLSQTTLTVTLTLTPAVGSVACSSPNPITCAPEGTNAYDTITLQNGVPSEIDFAFDLAPRTMTLTRTGEGTGSIVAGGGVGTCPSQCSFDFAYGSVASFSAVPDAGAVFVGWTGACAGQGATCSVTMTANSSTNAVFGLPSASPSPSPSPSAPPVNGPSVSAPVIRLASGGTATATTVPASISWSGKPGDSPLVAYQLQCRVSGGAWSDVALPSPLATSIGQALPIGNPTQCWVRVADAADHTSAWATGPTVTPKAYQETATAITYHGAWTRRSSASAWAGATKGATTAGATATFTFSGSSVALVAPLGGSFGTARIYVDRTFVRSVSLYARSSRSRQILFRDSWAVVGRHTLTVTVVGTSGHPRVDVDGFAVLG